MADISKMYESKSKYLKVADLQGIAHTLTISKAVVEEVGQDKEQKLVLYFVGREKGLVLNKTNSLALCSSTGVSDSDQLPGKTITIYPGMSQFQGQPVPSIKVDDRPSTQPGFTTPKPPTHATNQETVPF